VKSERLDWLADNPLYTKRFAFFVGRRCRATTIKEVAEELHLDWDAVKELDKQYMREQLRRIGHPAPRVIGIDEIAIAKGHKYRIVVSDLERGRPIWFGGTDRSAESLDEFFVWLGPEKCKKIRLAVMDMWKAFRNSTLKEGNAPQATILYDKFHILKHLGEAMDKVRQREYARACRAWTGGSSKGRGTRSCLIGRTSTPRAGSRAIALPSREILRRPLVRDK
jgi:transposase